MNFICHRYSARNYGNCSGEQVALLMGSQTSDEEEEGGDVNSAGADVNTDKEWPSDRAVTDEEKRQFASRSHKPNVVYWMIKHNVPRVLEEIEKGADVNEHPPYGHHPLPLAVEMGQYMVAEMLIKAGADVNAVGAWGCTALSIAVIRSAVNVQKKMLESGATAPEDVATKSFLQAARGCERAAMFASGLLIVNSLHPDSTGPVACVTAEVCRRLVKQLLQAGADVNIPNQACDTPFTLALKCSLPLAPFLKRGPDLSIRRWGTSTSDLLKKSVKDPNYYERHLRNLVLVLAAGAELSDRIIIGGQWEDPYAFPLDLVFVAGGPVFDTPLRHYDYEKLRISPQSLQHKCRKVIREHMMEVSRVNLFVRVPRLPITHFMKNYILYDFSLQDPTHFPSTSSLFVQTSIVYLQTSWI